MVRENGVEEEYKALVEEVKEFAQTYVYMKGREVEYANACKALCQKFDTVNPLLSS